MKLNQGLTPLIWCGFIHLLDLTKLGLFCWQFDSIVLLIIGKLHASMILKIVQKYSTMSYFTCSNIYSANG